MNHTFLAIAAGLTSGMLALASLSGASIAVFYLSLVHPLPLFYAGLSLGTRPALIASASAILCVAVFSPQSGMMFGVLYAVPIWLLVRLSLTGPNGTVQQVSHTQGPAKAEGPETQSTFADRIVGRVDDWDGEPKAPPRDLGWYPAGHIIAALTVMAGLFILGASVMTGGELQDTVVMFLDMLTKAIAAPQGEEVLHQAITGIAPYFAGMAAAMWAMGMLLNMVFAQGLLAKGGRNIRPTPRLRELTLPDWLSWALVVSALVALSLSGEMEYIGRNMAIVLSVPFFFLGLAVMHKLAGMTPMPGAILALVYLVTLLSGWFVLVITAIGILEQWVGLRARMNTQT